MDNLENIKNAFSVFLQNIFKKYSNYIKDLYLDSVEGKELKYGIYVTFNIKLVVKNFNASLYREIIDKIYNFDNFSKFFDTNKELNFHYIFLF